MAQLPLLIFPKANVAQPPIGTYGSSTPHLPSKDQQISRLIPQFEQLQNQFSADKAILANTVSGIDPEMVLVIEIAGRIDKFQTAIASIDGLDWLAEWDEEFAPDTDFYNTDTKNLKTDKAVDGRLFLSMSNQQGLNELLSLWSRWQSAQDLPYGKGKWKEIFAQIKTIRRWGDTRTTN